MGYDADGLRSSKTVNGVKTTYQYVGDKLFYENRGNGDSFYYFYDSYGNLSGIYHHRGNTKLHYHVVTNVQGDVVAIYSREGTLVASYEYDAWGNCTIVSDNSTTGIATLNPFRYRGYYYDTDLGLYYLQSRYYDAEIGRFINADGYISTGQGVLGNNMFAYCNNNPVNMEDSCGHCSRFLGFLWKVDCNSSSCPKSKKYVKPTPPVNPSGTYVDKKGNTLGNVYVIDPSQLKVMTQAKEKNDVIIIDKRTESNPTMQVQDSYKISNKNQQKQICEVMLDYNASNPIEPAWNRTTDSMLIEWDAHNDGYTCRFIVSIFKDNASERLRHVDLDNESEGLEYWDYLGK